MSINYGLNSNEKAVVSAFESNPVQSLRDLAAVCVSDNPKDRSSAARNSLRKLVRFGFVVKAGRGTYELTNKLASFDGARLKSAREETGMSQEAVKMLIGASSRQRVSDLERGAKRPSGLLEVFALSKALGCRVVRLFPVLKAVTVADKAVAA
jgi:DNA-binding XRE family transcriptional regulator